MNFTILLLNLFTSMALANSKDATVVAESFPACKSIQPFYWEIGDSQTVLASGQLGTGVQRTSTLKIASASKWIFGAYVFETQKLPLNEHQSELLRMLGGYTEFKNIPCAIRRTVKSCFEARGNDEITAENKGKFYYSGGDAQKLATEIGLGDLGHADLAKKISEGLHSIIQLEYPNLGLAGGAATSAAEYAKFLQALMTKKLKLGDHLGQDSVCASVKLCPQTVVSSPSEGTWKYSYHHWVEQDDSGKVVAYSSPGLMGFYPWLSADLKHYGIVAREKFEMKAWVKSAACGAEIRKAFLK